MSEEIIFKKGDKVRSRFSKLTYIVLDIRVERGLFDELKHQLGSVEPFRDLFCKCENGNTGWLCSAEVKKVKEE